MICDNIDKPESEVRCSKFKDLSPNFWTKAVNKIGQVDNKNKDMINNLTLFGMGVVKYLFATMK